MHEENRKELKCILEELYAIELLEYHDKNLLSGDNKTRSEWRQKRLEHAYLDCNSVCNPLLRAFK